MAEQYELPRLPPGMVNANTKCWRVTSGEYEGKVGLGEQNPGSQIINLRTAEGAIRVNIGHLQEVSSDECRGIRRGQYLGGKKIRHRRTHKKLKSRRHKKHISKKRRATRRRN